MVGVRHLLWGCLATDADFGPDGALYVSDWVDGWAKPGKGRIWRVVPESWEDEEEVARTRAQIAAGPKGLDALDLRLLLDHPDRRVRLMAQFALVRGARDTLAPRWQDYRGHLLDAAVEGSGVARLHGIWGLGMLSSTDSQAPRMLFRLLADPDAEVRAQTVRVLGERAHAFSVVKGLLRDPEPRVRLCAAEARGKYDNLHAVDPLIELVRDNDDGDPWIRHA
jgi:hypothetical protein